MRTPTAPDQAVAPGRPARREFEYVRHGTATVLAAFCVLGPALQPWYLTMLLPLYVFWLAGPRWDRAWLVVVVGFTLLPALQTLVAPLIAMPLLAVPLWWLWSEMSRRGVSPLPPRSSLR